MCLGLLQGLGEVFRVERFLATDEKLGIIQVIEVIFSEYTLFYFIGRLIAKCTVFKRHGQ